MRLLLYDYCVSTDCEGDLAHAGIMMLRSLQEAFSTIPEVHIQSVAPDEHKQTNPEDSLRATLENCDAALIVAPECDGVLLSLTNLAESMQKRVLGAPVAAIAVSSDKGVCLQRWKEMGLLTPRTILLQGEAPQSHSLKLTAPFVLKPNRGAGGENAKKYNDTEALDSFIGGDEDYLLQEYIEGEPLSVSCLVREGDVIPISLNRQRMAEGGFTCEQVEILEHDPREEELFELAKAACSAIPHLRGFTGIDLIYSKQGPVLMECNARITLAFSSMSPQMQKEIALFLLS